MPFTLLGWKEGGREKRRAGAREGKGEVGRRHREKRERVKNEKEKGKESSREKE